MKLAWLIKGSAVIVLLAQNRQHLGCRPRTLTFISGFDLVEFMYVTSDDNNILDPFGDNRDNALCSKQHANAPVPRVLYLCEVALQRISPVIAEFSQDLRLYL